MRVVRIVSSMALRPRDSSWRLEDIGFLSVGLQVFWHLPNS
jgi:hypothetical protein